MRADGSAEGSLGPLTQAALRHADELMWAERSEAREEGGSLLFVDVTYPAPRIIVFGAVDFAAALVRLARTLLMPALSALAGPAAPLAGAALLRNARRTALTVAMAGVGLGGVLWLMTLARSFEESLVHVLTGTLRAELFVTSANVISGWVPAPLDDELLQSLATVPGVVAVARLELA